MKKNKKRLIIISVIIIIILLAIFFIRKANSSGSHADDVLIKELNKTLDDNSKNNNIPKNIIEVREMFEKLGFKDEYVSETENYHYYWNEEDNNIYLVDDSLENTYKVVYPKRSITLSEDKIYRLDNKEYVFDTITSKVYLPGLYDENNNKLFDLSLDVIGKNASKVEELFVAYNKEHTEKVCKIVFPTGVTSIERSIPVNIVNMVYEYMKNPNTDYDALIESNIKNYLVDLKYVVLPNTVTKIGQFAFAATNLESIVIPESVTTIEKDAFGCCKELKEIVIPNSVVNIETHVFYLCEKLESVVLPSNMEKIGSNFFHNCYNLKSVTLPSNLKVIDEYAFQGCKSLTSFEVPNTVTEIGDGAFDNCLNINTITINNSVKKIGKWAFLNCKNLIEFKFEGTTQEWSNIPKGKLWNHGCSFSEVACSNGKAK